MEGFDDQLFLFAHVIENFLFEDEEAAIDAHAAVVYGMDRGDQVVGAVLHGDEMVAEVGAHAEKARDLVLFAEMVQLLGQRQVRGAVAVIGEEFFFALVVLFVGFEALADVGVNAGVGERDAPVVNVAVEELHVFAAGDDKIVGGALVVVQEVVLDRFGFVAEAKNKVFVPVVSVILHHMPENRPVADVHHGLRNIFLVANAQPHSAAKKNDFHRDSFKKRITRARVQQRFLPARSRRGNDGIARRVTGRRADWAEG